MIELNTNNGLGFDVENDIQRIIGVHFHVEVLEKVYENVWKNSFHDIENIIAQNVRKNLRKAT